MRFFNHGRLCGVACLLAMSWSLAAAQSEGLSDLLHVLWQEHPQLRAKRSDWQAQREGVSAAIQQFLPTPSISHDEGPANVQGRHRSSTARLTFPVFTGGQLTADLDIADLRQRMAALEVEVAGRDLGFQLLDLYRIWWFHNRRSEVLQWSLDRMDEVRQMMRRRSSAGVSAALDLAQAELQWQRTSDEQRQALRLRDQARADMAVLLGRPVAPRFEPLASWPGLPFSTLPQLQDHVLASHPGIRLAEGAVAQAQAELRKIKAGVLPNVSLRLERQYGTYYGALEAGNRVYVNTQLSTGAGLSAMHLQSQAAVRAQTAQAQVQAQRLSLQAQVQKGWNEHGLALQQLEVIRQQLTTQESLADAGVRLFAGGRRSWQDLLTLQREVFQLQAQVAELESAVLVAQVRLMLLADVLPQFSQASY